MEKIDAVIAGVVAATTVGVGMVWRLANLIRDRPRVEEVKTLIAAHDVGGHQDMRTDVKGLQIGMAEIKVMLENIDKNLNQLIAAVNSRSRSDTEP